jgi:hypothetical protein
VFKFNGDNCRSLDKSLTHGWSPARDRSPIHLYLYCSYCPTELAPAQLTSRSSHRRECPRLCTHAPRGTFGYNSAVTVTALLPCAPAPCPPGLAFSATQLVDGVQGLFHRGFTNRGSVHADAQTVVFASNAVSQSICPSALVVQGYYAFTCSRLIAISQCHQYVKPISIGVIIRIL